jgi:hypothetical protein
VSYDSKTKSQHVSEIVTNRTTDEVGQTLDLNDKYEVVNG